MSEYTPDQLAAAQAAAQAAPAPVPTGPDPVAAQASGGSAYEADIEALKAVLAAQQARLDALENERRAQNMPPLVSTVQALRDLLDAHANMSGLAVPDVLVRLADDAVAAAKDAVSSGDVSFLRDIAAKITAGLKRIHPGGGDHPFYRQAVEFARDHVPEACDQVTAPVGSPAPALGSSQAPVTVVAGSRVG
jgi:hypothetical protein